mmetsp:Transcript_82047/g.237881  ORF Transcript_82047/g.237881 Transcript_82047/m.237881 type:complete len:392 (-) Transcript_82047:254-1429(-)
MRLLRRDAAWRLDGGLCGHALNNDLSGRLVRGRLRRLFLGRRLARLLRLLCRRLVGDGLAIDCQLGRHVVHVCAPRLLRGTGGGALDARLLANLLDLRRVDRLGNLLTRCAGTLFRVVPVRLGGRLLGDLCLADCLLGRRILNHRLRLRLRLRPRLNLRLRVRLHFRLRLHLRLRLRHRLRLARLRGGFHGRDFLRFAWASRLGGERSLASLGRRLNPPCGRGHGCRGVSALGLGRGRLRRRGGGAILCCSCRAARPWSMGRRGGLLLRSFLLAARRARCRGDPGHGAHVPQQCGKQLRVAHERAIAACLLRFVPPRFEEVNSEGRELQLIVLREPGLHVADGVLQQAETEGAWAARLGDDGLEEVQRRIIEAPCRTRCRSRPLAVRRTDN